MKLPPRIRLFRKRTATIYMKMFRQCEQPGGTYPVAYAWGDSEFWYLKRDEYVALHYLESINWVVRRKDGPRGGWRWYPTDLGQALLDIIAKYGPAYREQAKAQLILLGYE